MLSLQDQSVIHEMNAAKESVHRATRTAKRVIIEEELYILLLNPVASTSASICECMSNREIPYRPPLYRFLDQRDSACAALLLSPQL